MEDVMSDWLRMRKAIEARGTMTPEQGAVLTRWMDLSQEGEGGRVEYHDLVSNTGYVWSIVAARPNGITGWASKIKDGELCPKSSFRLRADGSVERGLSWMRVVARAAVAEPEPAP